MADNDLADDVLNGMSAICRFLNIKERQGYDLAEKGRLPLFKLGGRKWQGRKSTLRRHIEKLEGRGRCDDQTQAHISQGARSAAAAGCTHGSDEH